MGFAYRLEEFQGYRERVGDATYVDISRRTDPARIPGVWDNLREVVETYGPPWVVQVWTKDVRGVLAQRESLLRSLVAAGTTVTAQVTVTGLAGTVWEPAVPRDGLRYVIALADMIGGADHIKWRYDPIIPGIHDPDTFEALAHQAAASGITRGVINFVAPPGRYVRVDRRLRALLPGWAEGMPGYDLTWRESVARELVEIASHVGISLACCAECAALGDRVQGLGQARCGDYDWFAALSGRTPDRIPFRGSRPGCGCTRYFDVGSYGHWSRCHRCAYCYAG